MRNTYSTLDYLGDMGGLVNALRHSFALFVAPLASFSINRVLLHSTFDEKPNKGRK